MSSRRSHALALAATLAFGVSISGAAPFANATSSGDRSVFVPITPCRLVDTRPGSDKVGSKTSPLGPGETFTLVARGVQGNCSLPVDAVGLAMNVAVIGGTAGSFLTVFPAGSSLPLAANLNWVAGQPPTPNKVDVGLSSAGAVSFYNFAGSVDIAVDVTGYYVAHDHDDRYYRKDQTYAKEETYARAEVDAALAGKTTKPPGTVVVGPSEFRKSNFFDGVDRSSGQIIIDPATSVRSDATAPASAAAPLDLPHGATLTSVKAHVQTGVGFFSINPLQLRVVRRPAGSGAASTIASWASAGTANTIEVATVSSFTPATVDRTEFSYSLVVQFPSNAAVSLLDVVITYTLP